MKLYYFIIFFCFAGLLTVSCEKTKTYQVKYILEGSSDKGYQVTYFDENNDIQQDTGVQAGWSYEFNAEDAFYAYISGFTSHDSSEITATILLDNSIFRIVSDTGFKVTATANGYIP
jgi:hypothetical protein